MDLGYNYVNQLNASCNRSHFADGKRCNIFRETSAWEDVDSVTSLFKDVTVEIVKNKAFDEVDYSKVRSSQERVPLLTG